MVPYIESIEELSKKIGFKYKLSTMGWVSILTCTGCSIGNLRLRNGKITNVKCYKRDYHNTIDETDYIFMRLERYLKDGYLINPIFWEALIAGACIIQEAETAEKKAYREQHPKKGRSKLTGRNVRRILAECVMQCKPKKGEGTMESTVEVEQDFKPVKVTLVLQTENELIEFAARMDLSMADLKKQRTCLDKVLKRGSSVLSGITTLRNSLMKAADTDLSDILYNNSGC